jgi:hypothetical protein
MDKLNFLELLKRAVSLDSEGLALFFPIRDGKIDIDGAYPALHAQNSEDLVLAVEPKASTLKIDDDGIPYSEDGGPIFWGFARQGGLD